MKSVPCSNRYCQGPIAALRKTNVVASVWDCWRSALHALGTAVPDKAESFYESLHTVTETREDTVPRKSAAINVSSQMA